MEQYDERTWFDPRTGDQVSLTYIGLVPDLPAGLDDLPLLRHRLALETAEVGALIEAHVVSIDQVPTLFQLLKVPIPNQDSGQAFIAAFTMPKATCSVVLRIQCAEGSTTGVREATVFGQVGVENYVRPHPYAPELTGRLPWHVADDAQWDAKFPDHPLSRARVWAHKTMASARIDPGFAQLPPFRPAAPEPDPTTTFPRMEPARNGHSLDNFRPDERPAAPSPPTNGHPLGSDHEPASHVDSTGTFQPPEPPDLPPTMYTSAAGSAEPRKPSPAPRQPSGSWTMPEAEEPAGSAESTAARLRPVDRDEPAFGLRAVPDPPAAGAFQQERFRSEESGAGPESFRQERFGGAEAAEPGRNERFRPVEAGRSEPDQPSRQFQAPEPSPRFPAPEQATPAERFQPSERFPAPEPPTPSDRFPPASPPARFPAPEPSMPSNGFPPSTPPERFPASESSPLSDRFPPSAPLEPATPSDRFPPLAPPEQFPAPEPSTPSERFHAPAPPERFLASQPATPSERFPPLAPPEGFPAPPSATPSGFHLPEPAEQAQVPRSSDRFSAPEPLDADPKPARDGWPEPTRSEPSSDTAPPEHNDARSDPAHAAEQSGFHQAFDARPGLHAQTPAPPEPIQARPTPPSLLSPEPYFDAQPTTGLPPERPVSGLHSADSFEVRPTPRAVEFPAEPSVEADARPHTSGSHSAVPTPAESPDASSQPDQPHSHQDPTRTEPLDAGPAERPHSDHPAESLNGHAALSSHPTDPERPADHLDTETPRAASTGARLRPVDPPAATTDDRLRPVEPTEPPAATTGARLRPVEAPFQMPPKAETPAERLRNDSRAIWQVPPTDPIPIPPTNGRPKPRGAPTPPASDVMHTVLVGLPIGGYLPLWQNSAITYWRMAEPDVVRDRLGVGLESRSEIDDRRFREAAMFSPDKHTLFLMDRFRDATGHLGGTTTQLLPATEDEAHGAADDRAMSELYRWLGEIVLAAGKRGEFVAVETGGWSAPSTPAVLIMLRTDGEEWHSVVETSPVPVGAPVWRDQQPVDGDTQLLVSPATDQTMRAAGLLTRFAVGTWSLHPFQLGLSFGPNPTLGEMPNR